MIQSRFSFLRNKLVLFLGTILFVIFIIFKFDQTNGNENQVQTLLLKIKKLELQNEAYNKQSEGKWAIKVFAELPECLFLTLVDLFYEVNNQEQQQRLTAERDLYERTKKELNANIRELKEVHQKENQDASLRLSSLQQVFLLSDSWNEILRNYLFFSNIRSSRHRVMITSNIARTRRKKWQKPTTIWKATSTKFKHSWRKPSRLKKVCRWVIGFSLKEVFFRILI